MPIAKTAFDGGLPKTLDPLLIVECTSDCVLTVDRDWRFTYLNQRCLELIAGGKDLLGKVLWEEFPQAEHTLFADALREVAAGGICTEVEDFYAPFDAWFSATLFRLPDGVGVAFRDTSLRQAENELLRSNEKRFRDLFETSTQGVIFVDRSGKMVDANPAAEQILNLSRADILALSVAELGWRPIDHVGPVPPEMHPSMQALRTGQVVRGAIMITHDPKSGGQRWFQLDAIPQFRPGETRPHQVYILFTDITEQKNALREVRDSRAHLARAQRVAAVGSCEISFATGDCRWSEEIYRLFGFDRSTVQPSFEALVAAVDESDRDRYLLGFEMAKQGTPPPPVEYRITRADGGGERTIYREMEVIHSEAGAPIGAISTDRDVTDLRLAEQQKDDLQRQLILAQRMEAIGVLAGGIAHDLNNTLVPILGLVDILERAVGDNADAVEIVSIIEKAGLKARDLVRQILAFSRRDTLDRRVVNVAQLLADSMPLLRASVPATIRIADAITGSPNVFADGGQLHQVVLNLVVNAAQAIGSKLGTITIELACEGDADGSNEEPKQMARLSVSDTGCGIDLDTQKRMFEPFFTTKPIGEGTRLGLSVVHGIVASHGGRVEVTSELGKGSRFDIFLPVLRGSNAVVKKDEAA